MAVDEGATVDSLDAVEDEATAAVGETVQEVVEVNGDVSVTAAEVKVETCDQRVEDDGCLATSDDVEAVGPLDEWAVLGDISAAVEAVEEWTAADSDEDEEGSCREEVTCEEEVGRALEWDDDNTAGLELVATWTALDDERTTVVGEDEAAEWLNGAGEDEDEDDDDEECSAVTAEDDRDEDDTCLMLAELDDELAAAADEEMDAAAVDNREDEDDDDTAGLELVITWTVPDDERTTVAAVEAVEIALAAEMLDDAEGDVDEEVTGGMRFGSATMNI